MKNKIDGIINVYKPRGLTSFQVVSKLREMLDIRKIGHTGTLDPEAEGVLVVCVGEATKIAQILTKTRKVYEARIVFGIETDTWDMEGKVVKEKVCKDLKDKITAILSDFIGEIEQIPPMYSAISYKGRKLYKLAREGKTIERTPRKVNIYNIKFLDYQEEKHPKALFQIDCSSGTYIRSLAYDLGRKIDCPSSLYSLIRKKVGNFLLENAYTLEEISKYIENGKIGEFLISIKDVFPLSNTLSIEKGEMEKIRKGQYIWLDKERIERKNISNPILSLYNTIPVALGEIKERGDRYFFYPKRVFNIRWK